MKCADPILCYNTGKTKIFRHYSLATPIHRQMAQTVLQCGGNSPNIDCLYCRKKKANELAMRCVLHASLYKENSFLTLTYDESKENYHNELDYTDIQKFKKRLRRHCEYHFKKRIQLFNVHEYGKNGKKHWHLVLFNHNFPDKTLFSTSKQNPLYESRALRLLWRHGYHTIGDVTEASALYQAQYTQKDLKYCNKQKGRSSKSTHSGIGRDYFLQHYEQILSLGYIPFSGRKRNIPRYFEKLAHKHYSYYFQQENFYDLPTRKALYRPFKDGQANRHMAELFKYYTSEKQKKIIELSQEWETRMEQEAFSKSTPDFRQAGENRLHDLKNKVNNNTF